MYGHEVLERSKKSLGNWVREHLFCILAKNLIFSAHVLRTQVRLNSKVMDKLCLTDEFSREGSVQAVTW